MSSALTILLAVIGIASAIALIFGISRLSSPYNRRQSIALKRKLESFSQLQAKREEEAPGLASTSGNGPLSRLVARFPVYDLFERLIERSASTVSADRMIRLIGLVALATGSTAAILTGSVVVSILAAALAGAVPVANLAIKAERRRRMFEMQLPDALDFMSRALRSGHGLTMAFQIVAEELPAPVSEEFKQVCDELNFGNSFHDALSKMPERINSADLSFFVVGILIQRETGGNLSDLLRSLSSTVRERLKLHGKVRTLAAEGKFSGILLGVLPFALAGILTLLNPTYMGALWGTHTGHKWVMIGGGMMVLGFAWMWKIAQIKV